MLNPAIVIIAYNRPKSLIRLLNSIGRANFPKNVVLHISIDKSDNEEVLAIAKTFKWENGEKKIVVQEKCLGLKQHVLVCGELTSKYKAIIVLEDDLLVSPEFYNYALKSLDFYTDEEQLGGISLYNYQVSESSFYPFKAVDDGSDVYFVQVASSWGQIWTQKQWLGFKEWFKDNPQLDEIIVPSYLKNWGEYSWKKHFIHYLIATNKYFVFPRLSLSTNFEDAGTHASTKGMFQVSVQQKPMDYTFQKFDRSLAVYDSWYELLPKCFNQFNPILSEYNYVVDLYGVKEIDRQATEFVLTSRVSEDAVLQFGNDLAPLELNISMNQSGEEIGMYKVENNTFEDVELPVTNHLDAYYKKREYSISVIIPILSADIDELKITLQSIADQNYEYTECLLITDESTSKLIANLLSLFRFNIKYINVSRNENIAARIQYGFKNASSQLLVWIASGTVLAPDCFNNVVNVFSSYKQISWIVGVDESGVNQENNIKKYRVSSLTVNESLKRNELNKTLELNFFKSIVFDQRKNVTVQSLTALFFDCIANYQQIVIVSRLGQLKSGNNLLPIKEKKDLLLKYTYLSPAIVGVKGWLGFFIRKVMIVIGISHWYYVLMNYFPDVLRYDEKNDTFFYSKY